MGSKNHVFRWKIKWKKWKKVTFLMFLGPDFWRGQKSTFLGGQSENRVFGRKWGKMPTNWPIF